MAVPARAVALRERKPGTGDGVADGADLCPAASALSPSLVLPDAVADATANAVAIAAALPAAVAARVAVRLLAAVHPGCGCAASLLAAPCAEVPMSGPLIVSANILNGNATVTSPDWEQMAFSAVTGGTGATISAGNLVFTATGLATIDATVTLLVTPAGAGTQIAVGYSWNGGAVQELLTREQESTGAVTVSGEIDTELGGTLALFVSTDGDIPVYWSNGSITVTEGVPPTEPVFPAFTPIIPPPPMGDPVGVPPFPPPTPPPMGKVPVGPLVGPAISSASVPPSTPGFVQPRFIPPGSATVPPANGYFPVFTTVSPSPPIVFANIWNGAGISNPGDPTADPPIPPTWANGTPPSTPTTRNIILNGWGLPGPQTTPPQVVTPPGGFNSEDDDVVSVRGGHSEFSERSTGSVLSGADAENLRQPSPPPHRRSKRVPAHHPSRRNDNP